MIVTLYIKEWLMEAVSHQLSVKPLEADSYQLSVISSALEN